VTLERKGFGPRYFARSLRAALRLLESMKLWSGPQGGRDFDTADVPIGGSRFV